MEGSLGSSHPLVSGGVGAWRVVWGVQEGLDQGIVRLAGDHRLDVSLSKGVDGVSQAIKEST